MGLSYERFVRESHSSGVRCGWAEALDGASREDVQRLCAGTEDEPAGLLRSVAALGPAVRGSTRRAPGLLPAHGAPAPVPLPLSQLREIVEDQVRQTPAGATVAVGPPDRSTPPRSPPGLREVGIPDPRVDVEPVERLTRPASGKLARFVGLGSAG